MANIFNEANPPNTEAAKLGAQRMRGIKAMLNNTLGLIYSVSVSDSEIATVSPVASCISTTMLADSSVSTVKIAELGVTTAKIADSNVTTAKLVNSSSTTTGVTTVKIADDAITTAKILNASVTGPKIADGSVTTQKIQRGIIGMEHIIRPRKWMSYSTATIASGSFSRASGGEISLTVADHRLSVGDVIAIRGTTPTNSTTLFAGFNGAYVVTEIVSTSVFKYQGLFGNTEVGGAHPTPTTGGKLFYPRGRSYSRNASVGKSYVAAAAVGGGSTTVNIPCVSNTFVIGDRVRVSTGVEDHEFNGEWTVTARVSGSIDIVISTASSASVPVTLTGLTPDVLVAATTSKSSNGGLDTGTGNCTGLNTASGMDISTGAEATVAVTYATAFPDPLVSVLTCVAAEGAVTLSTSDRCSAYSVSSSGATIELADSSSPPLNGFSFHAFS
jgi:hypothetical protein